MTKFVFNSNTTKVLDYPVGTFLTSDSYAEIKYDINKLHHDVRLTIDNMHLNPADIHEVIQFLTALNKEIQGE